MKQQEYHTQQAQQQGEYDDFPQLPPTGYGQGIGYPADPPRSNVEVDAKLISSGYKDSKLVFRQPLFKWIEVAEIYKNKHTGKPALYHGKPMIKSVKKMRVFTGKYNNVELDFPIPSFHSDSVTSSFLTPNHVRRVSMLDEGIMDLYTDMVENDSDHMMLMLELNEKKATIVETNKSLAGAAAQMYKTTISKGEQDIKNWLKRDNYDEYEARKQKKGILGLGGFLGFL